MSATTETLSMDLEDIIRKFPDDLPKPQLVEVLRYAGIQKPNGEEYTLDNSPYKRELMEAARINKVKIEQKFGVNFEKFLEEEEYRKEKTKEKLAKLDKLIEEEEEKETEIEEEEELVDINQLFDQEMYSENEIVVIDPAGNDEVREEIAENIKDDKLVKIDGIASGTITRWQVRYIGPRGKIVHGANNTHSGNAYEFNSDTWVDVEEVDFRRNYYLKVKNAIKANKDPHWQVRVETMHGKLIDFFKNVAKKVLKIKPETLKDVKHLTEHRIRRLHQHEIRSIYELLKLDKRRLIDILGVDRTTATEILDDARRSLQ